MDVQIRPGAVVTVQDIYAAFGRGDVQAILDRLADDVRWEHWEDNTAQKAGVPTMRGGTGKEAVAAFFEEVAKLALTEFTLLDVMGSDRQVAVEVLFDAVTPAGHRVRDEEMHPLDAECFWHGHPLPPLHRHGEAHPRVGPGGGAAAFRRCVVCAFRRRHGPARAGHDIETKNRLAGVPG